MVIIINYDKLELIIDNDYHYRRWNNDIKMSGKG